MSTNHQPSSEQMSLISFRVEALEKNLASFNNNLSEYVKERENDLKLKLLQDAAQRVVDDVSSMKRDIAALEDYNRSLKEDVIKRDAEQRESQAQLQIRVLIGVVSVIITIMTGTLVGYITHFFH